jgi:AcrR family transcriptional regulator
MAKTLVTEEQWLVEGIKRFGKTGISGLIVEEMAKKLGCAKSGFYWYFTSREQYVQRLLDYWIKAETDSYILAAEQESTPIQKISRLFEEVGHKNRTDGDFLFYLRELGQKNRKFANVLAHVEQTRISYFAGLLTATGYDELAAYNNANLVYCFYLGWYERNKYRKVPESELRKTISLLANVIGIKMKGGR